MEGNEPEDRCVCGHVDDEHGENHACLVEGCDCFYFEDL